MSKVLPIGILILLSFWGNQSAVLGGEPSLLMMEVSLLNPEADAYELHMRVMNKGQSPISIDNIYLPWIPPNDATVVRGAFRMGNNGGRLRQFLRLADYMLVTYTIMPGDALEGTLNLNAMFPSLVQDLRDYGVKIEWRCESKKYRFVCAEGEGGWIIIDRKSK